MFRTGRRCLNSGGDISACRELVKNSIRSGNALKKFGELAARQGAEFEPWDERAMPGASVRHIVSAPREGYIASMRAELVGKASMLLGAGRKTKDGPLDHSAGIVLVKRQADMSKEKKLQSFTHHRVNCFLKQRPC